MCEVVESFVPPNLAKPRQGDKEADIVDPSMGEPAGSGRGVFS